MNNTGQRGILSLELGRFTVILVQGDEESKIQRTELMGRRLDLNRHRICRSNEDWDIKELKPCNRSSRQALNTV